MIGHITKQFFRSYIMSPQIVLLFLGLGITICEAVDPETPKLTYLNGVLTCDFATTQASGGPCYTSDIDDCTVEFYRGAETNPVHTGADKTQLKYTPTRNGVYKCKAVKAGDKSAFSPVSVPAVDNLAKLTCITTEPATKDLITCGETNVTVTCKECNGATGAVDGFVGLQNGTDVLSSLTAAPNDWATKGLVETISPIYGEQKYTCVAATAAVKTLQSLSDEKVVQCTAVAPTQASTGANSGSTGGGSGSNTGSSGGSGGGGVSGSTGSGGSGTTSGASDLGRPASVLTIVCSLLALTLNLRG